MILWKVPSGNLYMARETNTAEFVDVRLLRFDFRFRRMPWRMEMAIKLDKDKDPLRTILAHALVGVSGLKPESLEKAHKVIEAIPEAIAERVWKVYRGLPIYQSYTGGPMLDFYTVPVGRRALISTAKVDGNAGPGIGTAFQLLLKASGAYYYLGAPLAYAGVEINLAVSSSGTAGGGYIAEAGESFSIAQVFGTNWPVNNIPVQAVAAATTTTLTLTSAKAQVNGLTEYVGTITGGAAAFSGRQFTVTGFVNAGNNGTFTCVTANTTSIVLQNIGGVAESASASIAYYPAVYTVAGTNTNTLAAVAVQISNCTNAANNGTFPVITSATQSLTLNNPNAVLESPAAASASVVIVAPFSVNAWIIEFDNTAALRSSKLLAPEVFTPQVLYTPSGSKNGLLVNVGNVPTVGSIYVTGPSSLVIATVYTYYVKGAAITQPLTAATTAANGLTAYSGNIQFGSGSPSAVTAATAIASSYAITTVAVGSTGQATYAGTFPVANFLTGATVTITGCSNAANNGTFYVAASTTTLVTVYNPNAVAASAQTATLSTTASTGYAITSLVNYAGLYYTFTGFSNLADNGTYKSLFGTSTPICFNNGSGATVTGQTTAFATPQPLYGVSVTVSGFSNAGNNGTFTCVGSTPYALILSNSGGVAETASATASFTLGIGQSNGLPSFSQASSPLAAVNNMLIANGDSLQVVHTTPLSVPAQFGGFSGMTWCNVIEF